MGFWAALATAVTAAVSLALAVTTPPRSGPYCRSGCVDYPYTDAAAFVPRDYLWMYTAVLLALLLIVFFACLVEWVGPPRRVLSRFGFVFTTIGGAVLVIDYAIQLTVLQPALVRGQTEAVSPWTQYHHPSGVFIALENVGYGLLNLGFIFLGAALLRLPTRLERAAEWFTLGGGLTWVALLLYALAYRAQLDYRFEVMAILISCLVLIAAPAMLAVVLARSRQHVAQPATS